MNIIYDDLYKFKPTPSEALPPHMKATTSHAHATAHPAADPFHDLRFYMLILMLISYAPAFNAVLM